MMATIQNNYRCFHRRAIVVNGSVHWCQQQATIIARQYDGQKIIWLTEADRSLLGQEVDLLIVDARKGFNPDLFGRATGAIRGGGLLVLMTPLLSDWPGYDDPQYERINVALYPEKTVKGRYIQHLVNVMRKDSHLEILTEPEQLSKPAIAFQTLQGIQTELVRTDDQQQAIDAVIKVVTGQRRRPVVLTADRGRGKSAAFGMAAAALLKRGYTNIVVCGPSILAVDALFEHAGLQLDGVDRKRGLLNWNNASIEFIPPDELVNREIETDLLLVDEAAAIPTPLLQTLLLKFPRIAFATTVHGYEGTGRGFTVRFAQTLDAQTRGWRAIKLKTPVRWAVNDPVERLVADMLQLNADPVSAAAIENTALQSCRFEKLDRDKLIHDERTLSELFGLLVLAHYRTRPFDLRHLLDGPNITIYCMRYAGHIVATALIAREGGFNVEDSRQIRLGYRRPHGHLLPELLAAHLGLEQAPQLLCARVMRIAVHPDVQRLGIGTALLQGIINDSRRQQLDYIGSSFGVTTDLLRFWRQPGFIPVRLSIKRGASSGEHSAVVIQGLNEKGNAVVSVARKRFLRHIFQQLCGPLRLTDPDMTLQLLMDVRPGENIQLDDADWQDIYDFEKGRRLYETCMGPVNQLVKKSVLQRRVMKSLNTQEQRLLVTRVLQARDWQTSAAIAGIEGRKQAIKLLRAIVGKLCVQFYQFTPR